MTDQRAEPAQPRRSADLTFGEARTRLVRTVRSRWFVGGALGVALVAGTATFRGWTAAVTLVLLICAVPFVVLVGRAGTAAIAIWAFVSGPVGPFLNYAGSHPVITFDRVWLIGIGFSLVLVPASLKWSLTVRRLGLAMATFCIVYGVLSAASAAALRELGPLRIWADAILLPTVMFFATARLATARSAARLIVAGIVAGGVIIAVIAISEARFGFELATRLGSSPRIDTITGVTRVSGPYSAPEVLALVLLVTLAITLYWTQTVKGNWYWTGMVATLIQATGIGLTFFRSAWIGAVIVGLASFALRPGQMGRLVKAGAITGATGIVAFLVLSHIPVFAKRLTSDFAIANAYVRISTDLQSLQLFWRRPLFGVGADQYTSAAMHIKAPAFLGVPALSFAHSSYLGLLAEQGLVGFAPFVAVTVLAALAIRELGRKGATWDDVLFYASMVGAGLAYLVMSLTLTMLPYESSNAFLALVLGLVAGRLNARASGLVHEPLYDPRAADAQIPIEDLPRQLFGRSWLLISAGSASAAGQLAAIIGTLPTKTLGRGDLYDRRLNALRGLRVDAAVLLSSSWRRQRNWQLFAVALAAARAKRHFVVDGGTGRVRDVSGIGRLGLVLSLPVAITEASVRVAFEAVRFGLQRRKIHPRSGRIRSGSPRVLALWLGSDDVVVGGSVTHISGILHGLRESGAKVGLLTAHEPPSQLAAVIDDLELIPSVSPASLLTGDTETIAMNRQARRAGKKLAERLRPTFIYQRHQAFLTAGSDLAQEIAVPLVLEWNASEVWVRDNWDRPLPVEGILDPFLAATERHVVDQSTLVAAVSHSAASMASDLGIERSRIITLPNGVDIGAVDQAIRSDGPISPIARRLGWIGTFGPWHGAEIAVGALSKLPSDVELLMIGEGARLAQCRQLAESLGVADRIRWAGLVAHDDALRRLATCSVLLSPHLPLPGHDFFGSPTKLFEYMALERPIVASNLGQIGEVLDDQRTALLVKPGDVDELARAIMNILKDDALGQRLAAAARREAVERHTWGDRARQLLEALNGVEHVILYA